MIRTVLLTLLFVSAARSTFALSIAMGGSPETCGNVNGAAWVLSVSGGVAPYTYAWTGPGGFTSTADSIYALEAGTYTVTVTDNVGAQASQSAVVQDLSELPSGSGGCASCAGTLLGYWGGACEGLCNGAYAFNDSWLPPGTVNLTYSFPGNNPYLGMSAQGAQVFGNFCYGESVTYTFTDDLGCSGTTTFVAYGLGTPDNPVISGIQGACSGGNGGSFQILMPTPYQADLTLSLDGVEVAAYNAFGIGTHLFSNLAAGTYDLLTHWNLSQCAHSDQIVIPDLGPNCNTLTGTSWYDVDADCEHDVAEVGIPGSVLEVEPGGYFTITHDDGSYLLNLPNGNYTLAQSDASLIPICPVPQPVPFTVGVSPVNIDLANGSSTPLDLDVRLTSNAARPGFAYTLFTRVRNLSPQQSGPVTVTCTFDPALTYINALPPPTNVVGNLITWDLPAFNSFHIAHMQANFDVPVSTPLGTSLASTLTVGNTLSESTLGNNSMMRTSIVTGSYDPNEKEVRTSSQESSTQYFIGTDNYLDYTIQFQNTGTDTAFTVVVTDTLDAALDMARFEQGASSHPCTVDFLPGRVVRWTFDNILLVDSTTNEAGSHGLTSFRIRLHEPVLPGTVITNNADIFFDFNEPVRTPDVTVVTETSTGVNASTHNAWVLHPNPSSGTISITGRALVSVNAVDLSGREVYTVQMPPTDVVRCDLSALPAGVYAVRVRGSDGVVNTLRLVMQ